MLSLVKMVEKFIIFPIMRIFTQPSTVDLRHMIPFSTSLELGQGSMHPSPIDVHFANLLLMMPYPATLIMVLSACEHYPSILFHTFNCLTEGIDFEIVLSNRVTNCPSLDPVSKIESDECQLPTDHSFHATCRKEMDSCSVSLPLRDGLDVTKTPNRLSVTSMREEILRFMLKHHRSYLRSQLFLIVPIMPLRRYFNIGGEPLEFEEDDNAELFDPQVVFSNLLLCFPYRPILNAVMTLYKNHLVGLMSVCNVLEKKGVAYDVVSGLPKVKRSRDCPPLDLLRTCEEECGRVLPCGHIFHDTCLRYQFQARTQCLVCQEEVEGSGDTLLPLQEECQYVKRELDGLSVKEMIREIYEFRYRLQSNLVHS